MHAAAERDPMSQRFGVTHAVALFAGVATVVLGIIAAADYFGAAKADVIADITPSEYTDYPRLTPDRREWAGAVSDMDVQFGLALAHLPPLTDSQANAVAQTVNKRRAQRTADVEAMSLNYTPPGWYHVRLHNDGDRTATDVRLRTPHMSVSCVRREGKPSVCNQSGGPVRVDTLAPGDAVDVAVWSSSAPSTWDYDQFRLTSSQGSGHVHFSSVPGPPGWYVRNAGKTALAGLVVCIFLIGWNAWREHNTNADPREATGTVAAAENVGGDEMPDE